METFAKHYGKLWGDSKAVKAFPPKTCKKREREEFFLVFSGITLWGEGYKTIQSVALF